MSDNRIREEGGIGLSEMLNVNTTLKSLNLSGNKEERKRERKEKRANYRQ